MGEIKAGLQSYIDVFGTTRNASEGQPVMWSTIWFALALGWLLLAVFGSRRISRGED